MKEDFHLVWWDGLGATMSGYPKMYRVWLTKHISKFYGSKVQQFYWSKGLHSPKCDSCGVQDKYTMHICRCKDLGCDQLFHSTINELHSWIESTLGNHVVATTIGAYLHTRGERTMRSLIDDTCADMITVLEHSNRLGWDSHLEGRITRHWLLLVAPFLCQMPRNLLPQSWGQQFIQRLHKVVHKQWTYRNAYIHFKGKRGWTMPQIQDVFDQIMEYLLIDTEMLLPRHRHLLDINFEVLGSGPTSHRLVWLADVEFALSASTLSQLGCLTPQAATHFSVSNHCPRLNQRQASVTGI
jgi:hypothetical protein